MVFEMLIRLTDPFIFYKTTTIKIPQFMFLNAFQNLVKSYVIIWSIIHIIIEL